MEDLISREDAIKDVETWTAVDEHERHLQKNVIEWLKEFPTAELSTNLASLSTDCISRQAAIDAIKERYYKYGRFAKIEELVWSIEKLPPIQPVNNSEVPNSSDCISRQAAIDGKICIQRSNGVEIYDDYAVPVEYLEQLSPSQPELLGTNLAEVGTDVPDINVGDLISRKAVLHALDKRFDSIPMEQTQEILLLRKDLREMPPITPIQELLEVSANRDYWQAQCRVYKAEIERIQLDIIHCKDCDWWTRQKDSCQGRCALTGSYPTGEWYCGNARKSEG